MSVDNGEQFWNRAIHDLRAGLRRISISAERLQQSLTGQTQDETTLSSMLGVREGADVIDRILTAMAVYTAAQTVSCYSFSALSGEGPLRDALVSLRARIRDSGAKITHGTMPRVLGDRDKLAQVFTMLIENAVLYCGEKSPEVEIGAVEKDGQVIFSVKNKGAGILPAYRAKLFTPFYRLHGSEIPGVGLGLATCRRIVELHNGKIWLASDVGEPTEFSFTIPAPGA